MKLLLNEPFKSLWAGRDPFVAVESLQGVVYRELEGRRTLRAEVDGRGYFVKIHRGIGWGESVKNLLTAKLPVLGARQEWDAIQRLTEVGVATMTAVAYGERGSNPALDTALTIDGPLQDWMRQSEGGVDRRQALNSLAQIHAVPVSVVRGRV